MSESKFVDESTGGVLGKVSGKKRWRARIIGVGKGSMGVYTSEAIATAAQAFPVGTKVNADHATWEERDKRPAGSIMTIIGAIATTPTVEEDGAYAEIEFLDEYAPLIEQIAPIVGLSIHASVNYESETEEGLPIVTSFVPHALNTVDVVTATNSRGKLLEVMESFKCDIMDSEDKNERIEEGMKPEDIEALSKRIVSGLAEALKPEPVEVTEEEKVDIKAVTEAVIAAGLPEVAREQVYAAIDNGVEVEEAIKAQKTYVDEIAKTFEVDESAGAIRKMDTKKDKTVDLSVGIWSK